MLFRSRGLNVGAVTDLRSKARKSGLYLRVLKNSLARRAVKGTPFEKLSDQMTGPLIERSAAVKDRRGAAGEQERLIGCRSPRRRRTRMKECRMFLIQGRHGWAANDRGPFDQRKEVDLES